MAAWAKKELKASDHRQRNGGAEEVGARLRLSLG